MAGGDILTEVICLSIGSGIFALFDFLFPRISKKLNIGFTFLGEVVLTALAIIFAIVAVVVVVGLI